METMPLTETLPRELSKASETYESLFRDFSSKVDSFELDDIDWILANKTQELTESQRESIQSRLYAIALSKDDNLKEEIKNSANIYKDISKLDISSWLPAKEEDKKTAWAGKAQSRDFEINFAKNLFVISIPNSVKVNMEERKLGGTTLRREIKFSKTFESVTGCSEIKEFLRALTFYVKQLFPAAVPVYRICTDNTNLMYASPIGGNLLGKELTHAFQGIPVMYESKIIPYLLWVGNEKERRRVFNKPALTLTFLEAEASRLGLDEYSKKLCVFLAHLLARSKERAVLNAISNAFMKQQKPLKAKVLFGGWTKQKDKSQDHVKIPKPREFASVLTEHEKFVPLVSNRPQSIADVVKKVTSATNQAGKSFDKGSYQDSLGFLQAARSFLEDSVKVRGVDISPILRARLKAWRQVKNEKRRRTGDNLATCTISEVLADQPLQSPYNPLYITYLVSTGTALLDNRQNVLRHPWVVRIQRGYTHISQEAINAINDVYAERANTVREHWSLWGPDDLPEE